MSDTFQQRLRILYSEPLLAQLPNIIRGIEKEGLRTNTKGELSQTPHPEGLGSALTHSSITTDYSEALLEFITPTLQSPKETIDYLREIHSYAYAYLGDELIWPSSMPCILNGEESIPIAEYGASNSGMLKHIYRVGLAHRYGKPMQTIAGVHYNFSLPTEFWPIYKVALNNSLPDQAFQTEQYFSMIRNFHRYSWLILYLFGASPALSRSFQALLPADDNYHLDELDKDTFYSADATSLRMSDLGYHSNAQQGINASYNSLESYVSGLGKAMNTPLKDYQDLGVKIGGKHRQLNTNILQIENEYYSDIRPKRVCASCQKPLNILAKEGVEYIEVRSLDINPFIPTGIDEQQIHFMDAFLLFCLLEESPFSKAEDEQVNLRNKQLVVEQGRMDNLLLHKSSNTTLSLKQWGGQLLEKIASVADVFDKAGGQQQGCYRSAVAAQRNKLDNVSLTPSAQVLNELKKGQSFSELNLDLARQHKSYFKAAPVSATAQANLEQKTQESLQKEAELLSLDTIKFDDFLTRYNAL